MTRAGRVRSVACTLLATAACGRGHGSRAEIESAGVTLAPAATAATTGAARPGMVWIPAGTLRAGSAPADVPRVAGAEPANVEIALSGFYIDALPWPNEAGAIPTSNVTRDEAKRLCEGKGKRLCSELEWERACKGPDNARYEYGAAYDGRVCAADVAPEMAARRPSGQRTACRSAFGVEEMHGGPSEWTDSPWGRGARADLGVVRGGSDPAGDVVSRCAYGRPQAIGDRSALVGFRCCAGPRNDAEVHLDVRRGPPLERADPPGGHSPPLEPLDGTACGTPGKPAPCIYARAWTWRPAPNVELSVSGGCIGHDPHARCAIAVSEANPDPAEAEAEPTRTLAQVDTGSSLPEVSVIDKGEPRLRVRGGDIRGFFYREVAFDYGRVAVRATR